MENQEIQPLSPYKPLDYLKLLKWIVFDPIQLENYQAGGKQETLTQMGAWLTSILLWSPFFLITLSVALKKLTLYENPGPWEWEISIILSIIFIIFLILTGLSGKYHLEKLQMFQLLVLFLITLSGLFAIGYLGVFTVGHIGGLIVSGLHQKSILIIYMGLAGSFGLSLMLISAYLVAGISLYKIGQILTWLITIALLVGAIPPTFVAAVFSPSLHFFLLGGLMPVLILGMNIPLGFVIQTALRNMKNLPAVDSFVRIGLSILTLLAYSYLLWLCYLGDPSYLR